MTENDLYRSLGRLESKVDNLETGQNQILTRMDSLEAFRTNSLIWYAKVGGIATTVFAIGSWLFGG